MRKIFLVLVLLVNTYTSTTFAQTENTVNDSLSVIDTLLAPGKTESDKPSKRPRRFSPTADLRSVDGLFLGIAYNINRSRSSDSILQRITALKSIRTKALILEYRGEWVSAFNKADLVVNALADIKGNILNYFGRGNDTFFDQSGDFRTFYRVNFSFYQLEPAVRFRLPEKIAITVGPSLQHFVFDQQDNAERYINTPIIAGEFDHLMDFKTHAGLVFNVNQDKRDDAKAPTKGYYFNLRMQGFEGFQEYANAYAQAFPQLSFYKSLDSQGNLVLANRVGAGITIGKPEFYQSAFLGSQDNLLGFRKFRFAGDHLLYNNFETRITFPGFLQSTIRGKIGLIGFYDVGRVWVRNEVSNTIHHGYGGGLFILPRNRMLFRAVAGFSNEGLQATVALRQRF